MIPSSENRVIYRGNGQTKEFGYSFKIFNASDIKVLVIKLDGTRKVLTSDYYVDMAASKVYYPGYAPGASEPGADTPPILQNGESLVVYREVPINQLDKMPDQWPFDTNEKMHDKSCVIDQQLADGVARSLKFGVEFNRNDFDPTLPIQAGYGWRVSDDGKSIVALENPKKVYEDTVGVYNRAVNETNSIKSQTQAIYNAAVADTTAIKNATNAIKSDTQNIYNQAVTDVRNVYNQAVAETTAIKNQAQAISDNSQQYAELARQWAESESAPGGIVGSKSSKTWAEQTASYLDEAMNMKNYAEALAAQVPVYSPAITYNIGDVVMTADGGVYRALATVTGESPTESYKWAKVQTVSADTFELDADGNLQVSLPATASEQWEVDSNGDVMIKVN